MEMKKVFLFIFPLLLFPGNAVGKKTTSFLNTPFCIQLYGFIAFVELQLQGGGKLPIFF